MVSRIPENGSGDSGDDEFLDPGTVVKLSARGREMWDQLLGWCSEVAGRPIDGDELSRIFKQVQADVGSTEPNYRDPKVMECFRKHLQAKPSI